MKKALFIGLIALLSLFMFGVMHEQVHVAIYDDYGIDAEVYYLKYFPDFVTVAEKPCNSDECRLAHNINDAIGYHLLPIFAFAVLLIFLNKLFR